MAHVYHARNGLQEKYDALRISRQRAHNPLSRYLKMIISSVILFVCVGILFNLSRYPNSADQIRTKMSNELYAWMRTPGNPIELLLDLKTDNKLMKFLLLIAQGILGILVSIWVVFSSHNLMIYALPILIGLFACRVLLSALFSSRWYSRPSDNEEILQAGLKGEQDALKVMRKLNNKCHVFTNVIVRHNHGISETDLIVVSPTCVMIIEVKNHKGAIVGDLSDEQLTRVKTLKNGMNDEKKFNNPIKQVDTHAKRLAGYLHDHGANVYVRSSVLFVNKDAHLGLSDFRGIANKHPVYSRRNTKNLIRNIYSGEPIGKFEFNQTVKLIKCMMEKE